MLFTSLGLSGRNAGLKIKRNEYPEGFCFFAFDINQSLSNTDALSLEKSGTVKLEIKFGKTLTEAVNCIVFSQHQRILEIDKFRQATVR